MGTYRIYSAAVTVVGLLLMSACGKENAGPADDIAAGESATIDEVLTAATLGEQIPLSNAEYLSQMPYSGADLVNGERQAQVCKACHSFAADGPVMIGPALHGFFGQEAGRSDAFAYSPALAEAEFVWTPRALDAWLAQPARFLPGNRMTFAGVFNQDDRDDLIAWLLQTTATENNDNN